MLLKKRSPGHLRPGPIGAFSVVLFRGQTTVCQTRSGFRTRTMHDPRCPECDASQEILRSSEFSKFSTGSEGTARDLIFLVVRASAGRSLPVPGSFCKRGCKYQTAPAYSGAVLLFAEARRIATNIAKLPEPLRNA